MRKVTVAATQMACSHNSEEISTNSDITQVLKTTINGTGIALLGSAASSIIGFLIMGFAPMPMFSSFGILTAIMILMSLLAALLVLPTLLLITTKKRIDMNRDTDV